MHQNIRFRGQPESRQFLGDRRFRRIAGDKQRVFIFITLRVNADATQRVEVGRFESDALACLRRVVN